MKWVPSGYSKSTGKHYDSFEACSAKCGWRPSRKGGYQAPRQQPQQAQAPAQGAGSAMLEELKEIKLILLRINAKLQLPSSVPADEPTNAPQQAPSDELGPDEEVPF